MGKTPAWHPTYDLGFAVAIPITVAVPITVVIAIPVAVVIPVAIPVSAASRGITTLMPTIPIRPIRRRVFACPLIAPDLAIGADLNQILVRVGIIQHDLRLV